MGILKWLGLEQPVKPEPPQEVKYYNDNVILNDGTVIAASKERNYIREGYDSNSDVYAIVNKAARKMGQVPWYVYKVQKNKTKELSLYKQASLKNKNPDRRHEIAALRKKALDENIVENELSDLLNHPNRNQGQDAFFEQLYGFKLLTGEGNMWKNRGGKTNGKPLEMFLIPRSNLEIIGKKGDPFQIEGWQIDFGGARIKIAAQDLIMWKFHNYCSIDIEGKTHLRGQSPLMSMYNELTASNEGSRSRVKMNKNQGGRGFLSDETGEGLKTANLTVQQMADLKRAVDGKLNNNDAAGAIAVLQGVWRYTATGMDMGQLKMIEQLNLTTQKMCAGFNVPYELFEPGTAYANKEMAGKDFLYNHIAPAAYGLRDELNRSLLKDFALDDSQYIIEPDVMALHEAMEDTKKMVEMYKEAWWYTPNERREKMGEDKSPDANMDKIYIPSSLQTLEDANVVTGRGLDGEESLLNQNNAI